MDLPQAALGVGLLAAALLLAGLTAGRRRPGSRPGRALLAAGLGLLGVQAVLLGLSFGD